jgi:hypothetical protein
MKAAGDKSVNERYVFFHLKTGGLEWWPHATAGGKHADIAPVIQIAAMAVEDLGGEERESETFNRLIGFEPSDADVAALNLSMFGSVEEWKANVVASPAQAITDFDAFLRRHATVEKQSERGAKYLVARGAGHFVSGFHYPFLRAWFKAHHKFLPMDFATLDTAACIAIANMTASAGITEMGLRGVCRQLDIALADDRDAAQCVQATVELARQLIVKIKHARD